MGFADTEGKVLPRQENAMQRPWVSITEGMGEEQRGGHVVGEEAFKKATGGQVTWTTHFTIHSRKENEYLLLR